MPNDIDDGGPAFPVSTRPHLTEPGYGHQNSESTCQFGGMTLRDWFAGQALSHPTTADIDEPGDTKYSDAAEWAYKVADAMIAARKGGAV